MSGPPRKRWFIDDKPGDFTEAHKALIRPAMALLDMLRQRVQSIDDRTGTTTLVDRKNFPDGTSVAARAGAGQDEILMNVPSSMSGGVGEEERPYLFVGVRACGETKLGDGDKGQLIVGVWEPWDKKNDKPRGILCTHPVLNLHPRLYDDNNGIPFGVTWEDVSAQNQADPAVGAKWWVSPNVDKTGSRQLIQVTPKGGMYMISQWPYEGFYDHSPDEAISKYQPAFPPSPGTEAMWSSHVDYCWEGPYDPMLAEAEQEYMATFDNGNMGLQRRWHVVVVLDIYRNLAPTDARKLLAVNKMYEELEIAPQFFPGNYAVKIGSTYPCFPVHAEVGVRVGKLPKLNQIGGQKPKGPNDPDKRFFVTSPLGENVPSKMTHPYGLQFNGLGGDPTEYGDNPGGRNWWAGAILADPLAGTVKVKDEYKPEHGLDGDHYWRQQCINSGAYDIYITTAYPGSIPYEGIWDDAFARTVTNTTFGRYWAPWHNKWNDDSIDGHLDPVPPYDPNLPYPNQLFETWLFKDGPRGNMTDIVINDENVFLGKVVNVWWQRFGDAMPYNSYDTDKLHIDLLTDIFAPNVLLPNWANDFMDVCMDHTMKKMRPGHPEDIAHISFVVVVVIGAGWLTRNTFFDDA